MSPIKIASLLVLFLLIRTDSFGQSMTQGTIRFEVIDVKTTTPEMQQMVGSMKGMNQVIEFDKQRQKMTMDMMGGLMQVISYWDGISKGTETYMDMMGQKIKTVVTSEQMAKLQTESAEMMDGSKIVYDKSAKKTILGKECYKATLESDANGQKLHLELYITEEIAVPSSFVQNLNQMKIAGTPLEWIMDAGVMSMTFQATEISGTLAKDFFTRPEGDYKEMSMEQLQQMGMGGQLGF